MLEKTATSSSIAAGESAADFSRSQENVDSVGDSSASVTSVALKFSYGIPGIQKLMHLFQNDAASSSYELPVDRKPLICVLGVPNHMTYADFYQFCGPSIKNMLEMRIVRTEELEYRYSLLIRLVDQKKADYFYKMYNGKCFPSLEEETCHMFFTGEIQYNELMHTQPSPASSTKPHSCPVCLEGLEGTAGILITICNHTFHCSCMPKMTNHSCPECQYCQHQPEKSKCDVCQTSENLWMCLICGFVGCKKKKHASGHWKTYEHGYSLELKTQHVWDYAGGNYVHRSIQYKTEGKLIKNKYDELLTSQLESQKTYFESLLQKVEEDAERDSSTAIEKALRENQELQKLQKELDKYIEDKRYCDNINYILLRDKKSLESRIVEAEKRVKQIDREIESLLKMNTEQHTETSDEAVADEPVADEAVADEAVADEPVADEAVADEPVAETSSASRRRTKKKKSRKKKK